MSIQSCVGPSNAITDSSLHIFKSIYVGGIKRELSLCNYSNKNLEQNAENVPRFYQKFMKSCLAMSFTHFCRNGSYLIFQRFSSIVWQTFKNFLTTLLWLYNNALINQFLVHTDNNNTLVFHTDLISFRLCVNTSIQIFCRIDLMTL